MILVEFASFPMGSLLWGYTLYCVKTRGRLLVLVRNSLMWDRDEVKSSTTHVFRFSLTSLLCSVVVGRLAAVCFGPSDAVQMMWVRSPAASAWARVVTWVWWVAAFASTRNLTDTWWNLVYTFGSFCLLHQHNYEAKLRVLLIAQKSFDFLKLLQKVLLKNELKTF